MQIFCPRGGKSAAFTVAATWIRFNKSHPPVPEIIHSKSQKWKWTCGADFKSVACQYLCYGFVADLPPLTPMGEVKNMQ